MEFRTGLALTKIRIVVAVILLLAMTACTDNDLARMSQALADTSTTMATLQSVVVSANKTTPPLISDATTDRIMALAIQINKAGKEATTATTAIAKLSPDDKKKLNAILTPVIQAVGNSVNDPGILGIQDQKTRDTVMASLTLLQTTLASTQLILAAK